MTKKKPKISELKKVAKNCDPALKELSLKAIDELEFMENTLFEYRKKIQEDGAIIETMNGNGFVVKQEHPASKAYTALIGRYNQMIKTVSSILLDDNKSGNDELMEFLGGKK